jgi:hypothetical protein
LHFLSWCSDEKEEQFFDKGWDFNILKVAYYISSMSKGLQEDCNKFEQLLLCSLDRWQKLSKVKIKLK